MRTWVLTVVLMLALALSASAKYEVRIERVTGICPGHSAWVGITIEPTVPEPIPLGGFDLRISYDGGKLVVADIQQGELLTECGWEYFHYSHDGTAPGCCAGCPSVRTLRLVAIAETANGAQHPTCFTPEDVSELVRVRFLVGGDVSFSLVPINFYWLAGAGCDEVSFASQSGNELLIADGVYNFLDQPVPPGFACSGPDSSCDGTGLVPYIDYYSGYIEVSEDDGSNRGDVNLNAIAYEIGDIQTFINYFIYGLGAFTINIQQQAAATETNCDGISLSVADLVFMIRVHIGDALRFCSCPGGAPGLFASPGSTMLDTSLADTMAFFGATGYQGQQHIPFDIHVANANDISGLQMRIEYDDACVTPDFDPVIGDGESVQYALVGRAADYINDGGNVVVKSVEPGELLVYMSLNASSPDAEIGAGSGVILRVYFDANPPITPHEGPVTFVAEGYDYNIFASPEGQAIQPTTVGGVFTFGPRPSCPVLFSHDGTDFVQENPLLTACEESGYRDVVTDYYHTTFARVDESGRVGFQLRELENEITFLDEIELIAVDHAAGSMVACGVNGQIHTYESTMPPISAIDENGNDRLQEIIGVDGNVFSADGPGQLVLEFPAVESDGFGISLTSVRKLECLRPETLIVIPPGGGFAPPVRTADEQVSTVTAEVLGANGIWETVSSVPPREKLVDQVIWIDNASSSNDETVTVRLTWNDGYTTDAVTQLVESTEAPVVTSLKPSEARLLTQVTSEGASESASDHLATLKQGDVYEVWFDAGAASDPNFARDYIIKARGRYQPVSEKASELASDFRLFDNYPNPFNPTTTISYYLPSAMHVTLHVYNTLGQRVVTLVDGVRSAGTNTVEWDGRNHTGSEVASGAYYYRLETSEFTQTKKMLFLK